MRRTRKAWLAALWLLLVMGCAAGLAEDSFYPFTVQYLDFSGAECFAQAEPVPGNADAYHVYVDGDLQQLYLRVQDDENRYTNYWANNQWVMGQNAVPLPPMQDAGGNLSTATPVEIYACDEDGTVQRFYKLYVSSAPAATQINQQVVILPIYYLDSQSGERVASDGEAACIVGNTQVLAYPLDLLPGYTLQGSGVQYIMMDADGNCSQSAVVFYYEKENTVEMPGISLVYVQYISPSGEIFYRDTVNCMEGQENRVMVNWSLVPSDYILETEDYVNVYVDSFSQATPSEVVFQFTTTEKQPLQVPFIQEADIRVEYRTEAGVEVASPQLYHCYEGNNVIQAAPSDLRSGYVLMGDGYQSVQLSEDGVLTPEKVVFLYAPEKVQQTYTFTAASGYCYARTDSLYLYSEPNAFSTPLAMVSHQNWGQLLGFAVDAAGNSWVLIDFSGTQGFLLESQVRMMTDAEVKALFGFTPAPTATPTPAPTPLPDGAPLDVWGETTKTVNFRKGPSTNLGKIKELKVGTKIWVYYSETGDGEKWYYVNVNGTKGYIMAQYVDLYTLEQSERYQRQLSTPMPTAVPTATPAPTAAPTVYYTPVPTVYYAPTSTPTPYTGYALTQWQVSLQSDLLDVTNLQTLQQSTLVYVTEELSYMGVNWSRVQVIESNRTGVVQSRSLLHISNETARSYMERIRNAGAATETPVPAYAGQTGTVCTLGDGVPLRAYADTTAEMITLPSGTVLNVIDQVYMGNTYWYQVLYGSGIRYVRADQVIWMTDEEVEAYYKSLEYVEPTPAVMPTPEAPSQNSLTCWGYVTNDRVRLRAEAKVDSQELKMLEKNAFAAVIGEEYDANGYRWYHVNQNGTDGYIRSDYFHVLSQEELNVYLQSEAYKDANDNASMEGNYSSDLQPMEDYNQAVWENPRLNPTYDPFTPIWASPTAVPAQKAVTNRPTNTPAPTRSQQETDTGVVIKTWGMNQPIADHMLLWLLLVGAVVVGACLVISYAGRNRREREEEEQEAYRINEARDAWQKTPGAQGQSFLNDDSFYYNGQGGNPLDQYDAPEGQSAEWISTPPVEQKATPISMPRRSTMRRSRNHRSNYEPENNWNMPYGANPIEPDESADPWKQR